MNVIKTNEKIEILNLQLEVFKLLHDKLGYRYCKKSGKEYFLKKEYGNYTITNILNMRHDLIKYIKINFLQFSFSENISLEEMLNIIYTKKPVTKDYARIYLEFNSEILVNDYIISEGKFLRK
ncbi:hypothetical protein [Aquimarina agarilytica]|uniref:hypothetical protein n=1 Tax=Aquimarina agarilytica TaxID=1087449 RepID=UPI00028932C5|nr:hypothetical protein [Aquimarina agarilytica]